MATSKRYEVKVAVPILVMAMDKENAAAIAVRIAKMSLMRDGAEVLEVKEMVEPVEGDW